MYPIRFTADYVEERSRASNFFRLLLAIPWLIVLYAYGILALVALVVAWFAIVLSGEYPRALYEFNAGVLRFATRVCAYEYLLTDAHPPFGISDDPAYPVRVEIDEPQAEYSRAKTLFRLLLAIPAELLRYLFASALGAVSVISWVVIVVSGRQPRPLQDIMAYSLGYMTRAGGYVCLLTDAYPPLSDDVDRDAGPPPPPPA